MPRHQLLQKREDKLEVRELPGNAIFVYDQRERVTSSSFSGNFSGNRADLGKYGSNGRSDLERIVHLEFLEFNVSQARIAVRDALNNLSQFSLLKW